MADPDGPEARVDQARATQDYADQLWRDLRAHLNNRNTEGATAAAAALQQLADERMRRETHEREAAESSDIRKLRHETFRQDEEARRERNRMFDRTYRLLGATVIVALIAFLGTQSIARRAPSAPAVNNDVVGALIAQVDRLVQTVAAVRPSEVPATWPVSGTVAIIVAVAAALGIALWSIFHTGETTDGLTKILSTAIVAIGGLFAISQFRGDAPSSPDWGDVAYNGLLAMLVCVGLATLSARPKPRPDGMPNGKDPDSLWWLRPGVGGFVAVVCVLALIASAIVRLWAPQSVAGAILPPTQEPPVPTLNTQPAPPPAPRPVSMTLLAEVRPFPSGVADPSDTCSKVSDQERASLLQSQSDAITKLKAARADKGSDVLLIVASADRDTLRRDCLRKFGSNRELAIARANWVLKAFRDAQISNSASVIVSGPTEFGRDRSPDRAVLIYRFVTDAQSQ